MSALEGALHWMPVTGRAVVDQPALAASLSYARTVLDKLAAAVRAQLAEVCCLPCPRTMPTAN